MNVRDLIVNLTCVKITKYLVNTKKTAHRQVLEKEGGKRKTIITVLNSRQTNKLYRT